MIASTEWHRFWEYEFLGNAVWQWAALLGMILVAMITGKIVSSFFLRSAKKMDAIPHRFIVLGLVAKALAAPISLLALAIALYLASLFMDLTPTNQDGEPIPLLHYWLKICHTLAVFAVMWFLYRLVDVVEHFLERWTSKTETTLDDQLVPLVRRTLRVFIVILAAIFIAQNIFEWNIGAMLAGLGIGGLAFALAAKDMLANFFGSATIFTDRPFQMGDRIQIREYDGLVEEVGFRSTRLRLLNGHLVSIPNAIVANQPVENISRRPFLKRSLDVTVTYDTAPEKLQRGLDILRDMLDARKKHFAPDHPPRVYFSEFNADSLNLAVTYWFTPPDWWAYQQFNHEFNLELLRRFNEEGIEFAFPTQTLYLKPDGPLAAEVRLRHGGDENA